MLFTSFEFLFIYLPITLAGYFFAARRFPDPKVRIIWLGLASVAFYSFWDYRFLPILVASVLFNYCLGIIISAHQGAARKTAFIVAVAGNLAALAFFKYTNFGIHILNEVTGRNIPAADIALPLGISFFTFTQIAYLADVYSDYASERSLSKYLLFVTYFPHLIAGPILHHKEMIPQFDTEEAGRPSAGRFAIGLTIFGIGLFKKAVIADGFALIANPVFAAANAGAIAPMDAWGGALAYSLQIYFDFSGYSDMAIGLSLLFGILLPFNFDSPYKARNISEFWRRWHITLSRFLRDYLYFPLGGNRKGPTQRNVNLMTTMLLGGLWHGANWTYVVWGGLHGLYLVINHAWSSFVRRTPTLSALSGTFGYGLAALFLTQIAVVAAWVYFRADNLKSAHRILKAMGFSGEAPAETVKPIVTSADLAMIAVGYLICLLLPNVRALFSAWKVGLDTYNNPTTWSLPDLKWSPSLQWAVTASVILFVGVFFSLIAGDGSQFLYFQF